MNLDNGKQNDNRSTKGETVMANDSPVLYQVSYCLDRTQEIVFSWVVGFQFEDGLYFFFIEPENLSVPQIRVVNALSPAITNLKITPYTRD